MLQTKPHKIALVYDCIYPYIKGGSERRYYELGKRLVNDKTEVHLYGMKLWPGAKVLKRDGLILHGIGKARPLYTKSGRRSIKQALLFGLSAFKMIGADFDTIDCCGFPYFSMFPCKLAAMLKHKPLYATWHEVWGKEYWLSYLGFLGYFGYTVEWLACRLPNEIITNINVIEEKLRTELHVSEPIHVIANGVDYDNLRELKPADNKSDIIFVGRLVDFKHVDVLIKAIAYLKEHGTEVSCNIVGDGPELAALRKLVNRLRVNTNVNFLGFVENSDDVYKLMKASKVLVLPSTHEGFGMVVIEAHACGLPVITIDGPDNAAVHLVKHQINGSVVSLKAKSIATAIQYWLTIEPSDHSVHVRNYDWKLLAQTQAKVYSQ
jgi:glycosyltransferase involved in cell wall biosynthesis